MGLLTAFQVSCSCCQPCKCCCDGLYYKDCSSGNIDCHLEVWPLPAQQPYAQWFTWCCCSHPNTCNQGLSLLICFSQNLTCCIDPVFWPVHQGVQGTSAWSWTCQCPQHPPLQQCKVGNCLQNAECVIQTPSGMFLYLFILDSHWWHQVKRLSITLFLVLIITMALSQPFNAKDELSSTFDSPPLHYLRRIGKG